MTEIVRQAAAQRFIPLCRGTVPLMGHSLARATLGLVGQPQLQKGGDATLTPYMDRRPRQQVTQAEGGATAVAG